MKNYSPSQFAFFRIAFGVYVALFFIRCIPFARDLLSADGMLPPDLALPFPGLFRFLTTERPIQVALSFLGLTGILFALGIQRRICALVLWYGYASLVNRLPTVTVPSQGYVGWLLLASALIPEGEPLSPSKTKDDWYLPRPIYFGAWAILALGYSFSGVDKLKSPSWIDGSALKWVFESPVVFDGWVKGLVLSLNPLILRLLTWFSLGLEILFTPLCLIGSTRKFAWFAMVLIHLVIVFSFDIRSVSAAMILVHFFVFDPRWIPNVVNRKQPSIN